MTSNKNTRILHNINCDELVLDTNNDAKNLHFNIRTIGAVGENDVEFTTCNVKVNDGSFHTDVIKDLDGNEFVNLSGANHVIKDVSGDPIMTIGDSEIDFHHATLNNLTIGSIDTSDVSSLNYVGQNLDYELDTIATNITGKLNKDGQTASKILTTSAGGVIQFSSNSSLLTQITTNQTDIATNSSSISTNASNISTNTTNIGTNSSSISTNASNISTNQTNIGTIGSLNTTASNLVGAVNEIHGEVDTLDGEVVKITGNQTIGGDKNFTANTTLQAHNFAYTQFRNFDGASSYYASIDYDGTSNIILNLPTSTGTLALTSDLPTATSDLSNDSNFITASQVITGGNGTAGEMIQTNGDGTIGRTALIKATTSSINLNTISLVVDNTTGNIGIQGYSATNVALAVLGNIRCKLPNETTENPTAWDDNFCVFGETSGGGQGGIGFSWNQTQNRGVIYSLEPNVAWRELQYKANSHKFMYQDSTDRMIIDSTGVGVNTTNVVGNFTCKSQNRAISIIDSGVGNYSELRAHADGNVSSLAHYNQRAYGQYFYTNAGGCMTLSAGGTVLLGLSTPRVGIGETSPSFPLEVTGGEDLGASTFTRISPEHKDSVSGSPNFYVVADRTTTNPTSTAGADSDGKIGIECSDCSIKAHYYFFNSDKRIKKEITDLSDNESLSIIRDISCVKYKYIDNVKRGDGWTYGFIANQVAEVFPNAVRTMKNTIPNEMRDISNCDWSGNKILVPDLSGSRYKLYYGNGDKEQHGLYDYVDGGFELDASYNQVFLYGKEIDDFHILDKSKIYAVLTSAVQELDKEVKVLKQKLADEETKTAYFEMKINNLYSYLNL